MTQQEVQASVQASLKSVSKAYWDTKDQGLRGTLADMEGTLNDMASTLNLTDL